MKHLFKYILMIIGIAGLFDCTLEASPNNCILAENGVALQPIIVATNASENILLTARELSEYLGRITGTSFEIRKGDGSSGIVLGTLEQFHAPDLAESLCIRDGFDGKEAYSIRSEPDRLLLLGGTDKGASHAVFRLLEILGCRWFFPAKEWEVIPSRPLLKVAVNESDRPTIMSRSIWYGWGYFDRNAMRCQNEFMAWRRHNLMGESLKTSCGHSWGSIIAAHKDVFAAHPEYLALKPDKEGNMKRGGSKFCISNPDLRALVVKDRLALLDRNPAADMVSVDPSDGGGHCQCKACLKMGSVSDRVFLLANETAHAVAQVYPEKMVGLYAYSTHTEPPSFALEPNVYVQLTTAFTRGRYSFDELVKLWPKKCQRMGFYDYYSVYQWNWDMPLGGKGANVNALKESILRFAKAGGTSISAESGDNWGVHGRGYYLAAKLMWNPQLDTEAILDDFYDKAFGPAATSMRHYYERLDPGGHQLLGDNLLAQCYQDVSEATEQAFNHPDVLARLDDIKHYLHYVHLRWMLNRAGSDKKLKKELTLAILTHVYRTRYTYMNHWEAMRQFWTPRAAKEFDEPSWSFKNRTLPHPWTVETPVTRKEIDRTFQEGKEYFGKAIKMDQVMFSSDLIPVQFQSSISRPSAHRYQHGLRYALYSFAGEDIELTVTPGTIAWYRNRPDAKYVLRNDDDRVVFEGSMVLDGERHALKFNVQHPGLYTFEFNDSGAGWKIEVAAGKPCTILLRRNRGFMHAGHMPRVFFYVPKGTESIQYYWKGSAPHDIYYPDDKLVRIEPKSGVNVLIPVPKGFDGRLWSFGRLCPGHLWFFNIPNVIATSPDSLLLPRELLKSDGLKERMSVISTELNVKIKK